MRPAGFLRTRVARRMLGLFLACALLPVTLLAVYGYRYVAAELETRARQQLRTDSKTAGMILLDRLAALAGALDQMATAPEPLRGTPGGTTQSAATTHAPRFAAVLLEPGDGTLVLLREGGESLPALDPRVREHLAGGQVGLVLSVRHGTARVFLVREAGQHGRLWGLVDGESVWGSAPDRSPVAGDREFCLIGPQDLAINCPSAEAAAAALGPDDGASLGWTGPGNQMIAGQWTMFLGRTYGAPSWRVLVSLPEEAIFAPLTELRRSFVLGLLLALATVFALTHAQLRRQTAPLEALEAATHRVAEGRFDQPVPVSSDDEFAALAGSFNRMAGDLGHQFRLRDALDRVHRAALAGDGTGPLLQTVFEESDILIPGAGLAIALARPDDPLWWRVSAIRREDRPETPRDVRPSPAELEEIGRNPDGFVARRGERARGYFERPAEVLQVESLVLPLLRHGALDGAIVVPCRPDQEGRPEALAEVRQSANQFAVAIANTQLVEQLDAMNWGTLTALARTIDAVSPWTAGHSERVTLGALEIGRRLELSADDLDLLHRGGLLHDIGKVGIPAGILDKPGKLTAEEYDQIKQHPTIGARILAPIGAVRRALPLVLHHHELLDGSGYPHGLAGEHIPLLVRILTVADVFDALVSDRPYRPAWTTEKALANLRESAGTKFDGRAVEALAAAVAAGWQPEVGPAETGVTIRGSGRFLLWPEATAQRRSGGVAPAPVAGA